MRVLLTGATGFIGSHLLSHILRERVTVFLVIRPTANTWRIRDFLPSVKIVTCDLLNLDAIDEQLKTIRPDICIHLAWYADPGKYLTSYDNVDMVHATVSLANRLAKLGCDRFVGVGTCLEYDTDIGCVSETSTTKPRNLYAACKLSTCNILTQLCNDSGMSFAWARLFYQYGPKEERMRFVPSIIQPLLRGENATVRNGNLMRDFLHVEDTAAAIWSVVRSRHLGPVNVGSARPVSLGQVALSIGELLRCSRLVKIGDLSQGEPKLICANNTLLRKTTDWVPRYDLVEGLRQTIAWWQAQAAQSYQA